MILWVSGEVALHEKTIGIIKKPSGLHPKIFLIFKEKQINC